jgi:hypothetical protein
MSNLQKEQKFPQLEIRTDFTVGKSVIIVDTAEQLIVAATSCLSFSPTASLTIRKVVYITE